MKKKIELKISEENDTSDLYSANFFTGTMTYDVMLVH